MTEKILKFLFFFGLLFLVFLAGIVAAINKTYFYWKIQEIYLYAQAKDEELALRNDKFGNLFARTHTREKGVTTYIPEESFKGYTFFTNASDSAYLINMEGRVVYKWQFDFKEAFPDKVIDEWPTYWRSAHLLPDGSLLAVYEIPGATPYGGGLIKIDKKSKLIWKYAENVNHDVDIDPNGNIYTIFHTIDNTLIAGVDHIHPPFFHDHIAILSENGEEIKRISFLNALKNSEFSDTLDTLPMTKGDITHINSVRYVTPEIAKAIKIAKAGDLLIGSYRTGAIMILDPEQEKITWLKKGSWGTVHNTKPMANGNLMFFDNRGRDGISGRSSRVLEYNPVSGAFKWQYEGTPEHPLFSFVRGAVQPLKNDNVLITESDGGRLLEVDRKGKTVWEYYSPQRGGPAGEMIGVLDDAIRYEIQDLPFLEEH